MGIGHAEVINPTSSKKTRPILFSVRAAFSAGIEAADVRYMMVSAIRLAAPLLLRRLISSELLKFKAEIQSILST